MTVESASTATGQRRDGFTRKPAVDELTARLAAMAGQTQRHLSLALDALTKGDLAAARSVIDSDRVIDSYETDIDVAVYRELALKKLSPEDVRTFLAIQKTGTVLERIGDHAVNIAESALALETDALETPALFLDIPHMAELVQQMLRDALQALFDGNAEAARQVLERDEAIDALNAGMARDVKHLVMESRMNFECAMEIVRVSRNLERIADLSTNIAEETIFSVEARSVKHCRSDADANRHCGAALAEML